MPDQLASWPFQFEFPRRSIDPGPSQYIYDISKSDTYTQDIHDLPPSFTHEARTGRYAQVKYTLQVIVYFENGIPPYRSQVTPVAFCPLSGDAGQIALAEHVKDVHKHGSDQVLGEGKSIMRSLRKRLSSSAPSFNIIMRTSVPTGVLPDKPFSSHTCLEIDPTLSQHLTPSSVTFKLKKVELRCVVVYRALRIGETSDLETEEVESECIILDASPKFAVASPGSRASDPPNSTVFPATFTVCIPERTACSFRTFNINHNFQLRFTVGLEAGGKTLKHKVEVLDLVVLPG